MRDLAGYFNLLGTRAPAYAVASVLSERTRHGPGFALSANRR
jgi:hypothetical protein